MGTWEHKNIARSPPLGIFCWGRSLKIQREIKREVFTYRERKAKWNRGGGGKAEGSLSSALRGICERSLRQGPGMMMCAAAAAAASGGWWFGGNLVYDYITTLMCLRGIGASQFLS
jgi:hypothetical protein